MILPIFVKTVLLVVLSVGIADTAATDIMPAISAYSTRSCPWQSCQKSALTIRFIIGNYSFCIRSARPRLGAARLTVLRATLRVHPRFMHPGRPDGIMLKYRGI